jgi:hypothetical protein
MHGCMMTKAGSARDRHPSASVSVKALSFCGHELPLELLLLSAHHHFCHQCRSHQHHVPALVPAHPRRCSRIATGHLEQLRTAACWHACSSAQNKHLAATQLHAQHAARSLAQGWPPAATAGAAHEERARVRHSWLFADTAAFTVTDALRRCVPRLNRVHRVKAGQYQLATTNASSWHGEVQSMHL